MFKKLLRAGAALGLALLPFTAHAQEVRDADPALWVVKDKDTTIYLFGTVHVLKPGLSWFDEAVRKAFDASGEVVLEMLQPDPAAMQALILKTAVNQTGPSLPDRLPEPDRAPFAKAVADLGMPAGALDRFDPWFAATNLQLIPLMKLGYDPASGAEKAITDAATAAGKPVIGLETAEQQIGYLDGLSEPAQVKFLTETVKEMGSIGTTIDKMVVDWSAGDADALAVTLNESMRESPEVAKVLLTDRNIRWADWIQARMAKPGTVFVAVGAGHLAGSDSVQVQLGKRKLTATRVAY
jgi:uncharacterized protein YbaP (TraB family)